MTSSPGNFTATTPNGSSTSATVLGLTNGIAYTFTVVATNAGGSSSQSTASTPVTPSSIPGVATNVIATAGNTQATIKWTAPVNNGGSTITGYTVTSSPGGFTATGTTSATVTGLTNGTAYTFTVVATNNNGSGLSSIASNPVIPSTSPDAPSGLVVTTGNDSAFLKWNAPYDGGSEILYYTISTTYTSGSTPTTTTETIDAPATTAIIPNLLNGVTYTVYITATNITGISDDSSSITVTIGAPSSPSGIVATITGTTTALVKWNVPYDGGSEILYYTVSYPDATTPSTITQSLSPATSAVVTNLESGYTYTFTVTAYNAVGTGTYGTSNSITMASAPSAPSSVVATPGNYSALLSWPIPDNNGSPITSYEITAYNALTGSEVTVGAIIIEVSEQTVNATVSGLINGTAYKFNVTATNSVGTGSGTISNTVVPGTLGAPTSLEGVSGNTNVQLSWAAPAGTVTGYIVSCINNNTGLPIGPVGNISISGTTANVSELENGTPYTFTVSAVNDVGIGLPSSSIVVTPNQTFLTLTFSALLGTTSDNITYTFTTNASHIFTCNLTALQQAILADGGDASPYVYKAVTTISLIGNGEFQYAPTGLFPNNFFNQLISAFIPLSVTYIDSSAFFNCTNLSTIQFEGSAYDFVDSVDQTTSPLTFINLVFSESGLTKINLPNRTTSIGNSMFLDCTSLTEVIFPTNSSFTTIPYGTCNGCTNLLVLQINSNVTSIIYSDVNTINTAFGNIPSFTTPLASPPIPPTPTLFTDSNTSYAYIYFSSNYPGVKIMIGVPCFNFDTKILCLVKEKEKYIPVQNLRKGDLVKTYLHGYRKIDLIEKGRLINNVNVWHNCMYKMKKTQENGLIEDLIVTGGHGILVDNLLEEERDQQEKLNLNTIIDDKHLLTSGFSNKFVKIKDSNVYEYYSLVIENDGDDNQRFGIWANGILAETPSKNQSMKGAVETKPNHVVETKPNQREIRMRKLYLKKLEILSKIRVQHNIPIKKSNITFTQNTHKYT